MLISVSIGEVCDKITILELKQEKIKDLRKLKYVKEELEILEDALLEECQKIGKMIPDELFEQLKKVNEELWETEDVLREKEKYCIYDDGFIENAIKDSELNDLRFLIKEKINKWFDEKIREQKSYEHLKYEVK